MKYKKLYDNSIQFDYFSENFLTFEQDFYKYSNMVTPLTFMTDDILRTMSEGQINYFRLPASKSKDNLDHYFLFNVKTAESNPQVRIYEYLRHVYTYERKVKLDSNSSDSQDN